MGADLCHRGSHSKPILQRYESSKDKLSASVEHVQGAHSAPLLGIVVESPGWVRVEKDPPRCGLRKGCALSWGPKS